MGLMLKRQTLTGSTLRARPDAEKAAIAQAVQTHVWPWIEAGKVRPRVDSTFALDEVSKAHARMDAGGHAGKILLVP
jgi:NADPH2:quinone reductase